MHDRIHDRLQVMFGATIMHWPAMPKRRASAWEFWHWWRDERLDNAFAFAIGRNFTDADCLAYWTQVRRGQLLTEDAGGYRWRCWCVALGLPFDDGETLKEGIGRILAENLAGPAAQAAQ